MTTEPVELTDHQPTYVPMGLPSLVFWSSVVFLSIYFMPEIGRWVTQLLIGA